MWSIRLLHEMVYWEKSAFVTLTYAENYLPENGTLVKPDLQKFIKRLRKNTKRKMKYFSAGEYGEVCKICGKNNLECRCIKFIPGVGRPHYHLILFGFNEDDKEIIEETWDMGMVHIGTVTKDSIKYVSSYIEKKWTGEKARSEYGKREIPFQVASQGMGSKWVDDNKERICRQLYITRNGVKVPLPRYYKDRLGINHEQTIGLQIESIQATREWFDKHGIPEDERSKYEDDRAKQKAEELAWIDSNKTKPKAL